MSPSQSESMRWYLFWVFVSLFVLVSVLTILALFFNVGNLKEQHQNTLIAAVIVEITVAVVALFYGLFGLKPRSELQVTPESPINRIPAHVQEGVRILTSDDAPLDPSVRIALDRPAVLGPNDPLRPYAIGRDLIEGFHEHFEPVMITYAARVDSGTFRPNAIMQIEKNVLPESNMTLVDYVNQSVELLKGELHLKGTREIRAGFDTAVQWYSHDVPMPTDDQPERVVPIQQFQKFVVSGERLGILTISYSEGADPEHIRCLHELLSRFAAGAGDGSNRASDSSRAALPE